MDYRIVDHHRIEIDPEEMPIKDVLLAIASKSYETAVPRGMGFKQPFMHSVENMPDFEENIEMEDEQPTMLLMDYINGRDCRTKVYKAPEDGKWYFDNWAFQQRKVTSEEFHSGIIRDSAHEFLDKVIEEVHNN